MIRVGIVGATGYTGLELAKILLRHPEAQIVAVTSRQEGRPAIAEIHPHLAGRLDLQLELTNPTELADQCDCVFTCLPHGASAVTVAQLLDGGTRVVDFSADYRLTDLDVYQQWYGGPHPDPDRVGCVPYGLPEFFGAQLQDAPLVANPGCYPTSAILGLGPLLQAGAVEVEDIIIDSKSGVSGAGRSPKVNTLFCEVDGDFAAYNLGQHRHTPEIAQVLSHLAEGAVEPIFSPHLVPMDRGILTTAYARRADQRDQSDLLDLFRTTYRDCAFIRVLDTLPHTKHSAHTNYCDVTVRVIQDRVIVVSCIDNLVKGASGAAVQNMNRMFGLPETTGLI